MRRRWFLRLVRWPPRMIYALGLGRFIGCIVLLLTTTGRKSGRQRTTPLQYEAVDGVFYITSVRGQRADWFRNVLANPRVEVRIGSRHFSAQAEPIIDPGRIADMLQLRLRRHPRMIAAMPRFDSVPVPPGRTDLEN